jgi:hypothetical protein
VAAQPADQQGIVEEKMQDRKVGILQDNPLPTA